MHCPVQYKVMKSLPSGQWGPFTYTENHAFTSENFGFSVWPARTNMSPVKMSFATAPSVDSPGRRPAKQSTVPYFMDGWRTTGGFISWMHWRIDNHVFSTTASMEILEQSYPHGWQRNVIYLDGHVELTTYKEGLWEGSPGPGYPVNWSKMMQWKWWDDNGTRNVIAF